MKLRHNFRNLAKKVGLDVRRLQPFSDEFDNLVFMLEKLDVKTVVDVGANNGGFGSSLFGAGYKHKLISFEPLPKAHAKLTERSQLYEDWHIMPACAVGRQYERAQFNVAGNSSSSSLLVMNSLHTDVAPKSKTVDQIEVTVERLDVLLAKYDSFFGEPFLLKIDTQGSEGAVLEGAIGLLDSVMAIRTEVSFVSLYEGQILFDELYSRIRGLGFDFWDLTPVLRDARSGKMIQGDATFVRSNAYD